jgi:hypothetical protein
MYIPQLVYHEYTVYILSRGLVILMLNVKTSRYRSLSAIASWAVARQARQALYAELSPSSSFILCAAQGHAAGSSLKAHFQCILCTQINGIDDLSPAIPVF